MLRHLSRPVPTLLVTGFLGAGKTTLLSGWLAARPAGERWAVLVNEFGALGVDRALLGGDCGDAGGGEVAVAEVAGGCACCAAQVAFDATLTRLLRRGPWDRLLVETTGLGHPAKLVDRLRAPRFAAHVALRPAVAVVDASRAALYLDAARPDHAIALDQAALARVLVLNRADALPPGEADALAAALAALPPWPRAVLRTADGTVPLAMVLAAGEGVRSSGATGPAMAAELHGAAATASPSAAEVDPAVPTASTTTGRRASDAPSGRAEPGPAASPLPEPMRWQRADPDAGVAAAGWWWPATAEFDRARLQAALDALAGPDGPLRACGLLRGKGVFRTERAWYGWQWADGRADWRETAWRTDNRLEVLAGTPIDPQVVDRALRAAAAKG